MALVLALALAPAAGADPLAPVRAFRVFDRATAPELPESIVVDLLQDRDGVLWVDTLGGLATYDGATLRAVVDPEAPRSAALLTPRRAGGLYAVSRQGLHVFDGRWRRIATPAPVISLAEASDDALWAVHGGALWTTPTAAVGRSWTRVALPESLGKPQSVFSDHAGGMYVFGADRLVRCRDAACAPMPGPGRVPARAATALAARDGALWIGTWDGGLFVAAPGAADWTRVDLGPWPSGGVRSLAEGRDGRLWVGGMARLCQRAGDGAWSCWGAADGLPDSAVLSLLADREGTLWLGLNGRGLLQWVGQPWTHLTRWPGASASGDRLDVIAVAPTFDGRGLLASAFGRGILRWDGRETRAWGRESGLTEDVRAVVEPAAGVVWAGARHGLFEKEGAGPFRRTLDLEGGFASGFARAPDGTWYVYTEAHGIFERRGRSWVHAAELETLAERRGIRALGFTPSGDTWISTPAALVIRRASGDIERYALGLERGPLDTVATLVEREPGELWAGGQGGVAVLTNGRWRRLSAAEGLAGNVYFLRRAADGALWMGGSRGIARLRDGRVTRWDRANGLVGDESNGTAVVLPDGTLYAGMAGSLARFDPRVAVPAPVPLHVLWRSPDEARGAGELARGSDQRRVVLEWSAPSLDPAPVEYATRIGGGAWQDVARQTQLVLESLPSGLTEVAVRARRSGEGDGAWSEPATLRLQVAPFWWETRPARAALALAFLGLVMGAALLVVRRVHARREASLARLRADFVASASHDLRTPIAQIRLFADMLRLGRARGEDERADALDTIHRATRRLEALSDNLLQLSRGDAPGLPPRRDSDVAEALHEAARDLEPLARARRAELRVAVAPGLRAEVDGLGLLRIVSNLVENALKYGPAGQVVSLGADLDDGLRIVVEDEGPGIPPAERERVFERFARLDRDRDSAVSGTGLGLAVVRETAAQSGGTVRIEDAAGGGARVVVALPQREAAR